MLICHTDIYSPKCKWQYRISPRNGDIKAIGKRKGKISIAIVRTFAYNKDRWKNYSRKEMFYMATKSANLYARIEPEVKEKAESILSALGIPASSAINMFYKQIILQRGLPFEVKIPSARPVDISTLSEVEFNEELEKGYADMHDRRTKNAKKAFADIRKDYGL